MSVGLNESPRSFIVPEYRVSVGISVGSYLYDIDLLDEPVGEEWQRFASQIVRKRSSMS